nr:hypothetical protein [Tanacetum cinerariifolium]
LPGAWKLLGLSGEGSGSRGEVVELGWNGGSWWENGWWEIQFWCYSRSYLNGEGMTSVGFLGFCHIWSLSY